MATDPVSTTAKTTTQGNSGQHLTYQIQNRHSAIFLWQHTAFCGLTKINNAHSLHRAIEPAVHERTAARRGGERDCSKDTLHAIDKGNHKAS